MQSLISFASILGGVGSFISAIVALYLIRQTHGEAERQDDRPDNRSDNGIRTRIRRVTKQLSHEPGDSGEQFQVLLYHKYVSRIAIA